MQKNTSGPQIWHKIFNELNKAKIEYVLVGGTALVVHGLPRSTLDIDIYVPAKKYTLIKIFQIADGLGLKCGQKAILHFADRPDLFANQWICFSFNGQDILDVFFANENEFNRLFKKSSVKKDKNISIRVGSLDDIASMKRASGRKIDIADLEFIKEAKKYRKKIN